MAYQPELLCAPSSSDPTGANYLYAQQAQKSQADCANQQTAQSSHDIQKAQLAVGAIGGQSAYIGDSLPNTRSKPVGCPNCGYCSHCGRGGWNYPSYSYPNYPQTIWGGANTQYLNAQAGQLYK